MVLESPEPWSTWENPDVEAKPGELYSVRGPGVASLGAVVLLVFAEDMNFQGWHGQRTMRRVEAKIFAICRR